MVAVVSGNGLGLFNSSLTQLGSALGGQAGIGQSRDSQYLNIATGNLLLTGWDESLFGRGLSTGLVRTYNSAGSFGDTGADGWQTGYERTVRLASGSYGADLSTVERTMADGAIVSFAWDAARNAYVSTTGDGAHDTIVLSGSGTDARWLWTEGSSQTQETYTVGVTPDVAGRLERIADLATGAVYDFTYTGSQLTKITGANGETLEFGYDTVTGALTSLSTREINAAGELSSPKTQVTYGYDDANRLSWVQTDLTPDDATDNTWDAATAANNDGKRFRTTYTYADATSLRITNVSSSDGVSVTYSYDGSGRVASITQGSVSDGSAQTLTYTYNAGATDVTDSAGRTWTYQYDGDGQLTAVLAPAVNGQRPITSYSYDADGNVVRISQAGYAGAAATQDTVFAYDGNGNVLLQRDLAGNTVERTYNAANRVLTEAVYTTPDADGLDPDFTGTTSLPAGALVTRYVYDASNLNQLRFVINAAGDVSEHQYYGTGPANGQQSLSRRFLSATYDLSALSATQVPTLVQMTDWVAGKEGQTSRSDVAYDAQGRITQTVAYASVNSDGSGVLDAAAAITTYTYDAQGLLRQKVAVYGASRTLGGIAPAGSTLTEYVYDGLGRLLGALTRDVATASNDDAGTLATSYAYLDAANQLQVTLDSGAVRIEARNQAGLLVSVSEANAVSGATVTRTTQNFYDASGRLRAMQDASGARSYLFYDAAGRLSATVDATGAVTETRYDEIGRAIQTIGYATRVDTGAWLVDGVVTKDTLIVADTAPALAANAVWVDSDAATDRNATRSYDAAGRLATETNATGLVTTYVYDGASRLLSTTVSQPNDATVIPRVTRYFHDATGRQVGTLDAAGYLTESVFDAGGRLVQTIRYATLTDPAFQSAGTLAELRPLAAAADQGTRYFYDARGQQRGVLNAEGYLTEFVTDEAGNQRAVKAYAKQLTGLTGTETVTALRSAALTGAPSEAMRVTQRSFNGLGQLVTELNAEGTVTRYSYDDAGRLVRTESAAGTSDVRENFDRYDVFGQLIGELSGEQAVAATATLAGKLLNDPSLTETQLNAVYSQFGTTHVYDLRGQRTESVDASGAKTFYFYDSNGHSTFTVRGIANGGTKNALGEVTETRYSAFGQVTDTLVYTGRIAIAGMQTRDDVQSAINVLTFVAASDSRRTFGYDQRGLLTRATDAENVISNTSYTAFGQLAQEQRAVGTSAAVTIEHSYDQRGLEIGRTEGVGTAIARSSSQTVDAFGRVTSATDARGNVRTFAYDRLGRQISRTQVVAGRTEQWQTSYDAFSQVVSQTDALGRTTTYAISDSNRSVTITTPELIVTASVHNRFGQTVTATDGNGASTTFTYDKNGALLQTSNALGQVSDNDYDVRGLLTRTTDASGHLVDYTYDAAGRVLSRIEDPAGLALTTTTSYDGQGRTLTVTDPSGAVSTISYDREGRVLSQAHDPSGLNLRTNYTWDAAGRQLTVVEAAGTTVTRTTQYIYDELGRRTSQIAASGTLNLTTTFAYDANDNVVGSTDATGNLTRFAYDEANRLRFSVDALGGVTETAYDANGRVTMTRQYVTPISLSGLPTAVSSDTLSTLVSNDALDLITYRVYDRNGRVRATIDSLGDVALLSYDAANNVTVSRRYANAVTLTPELIASILAGTASAEDILVLPGNSAPSVANPIADQTAVREQAFSFTFAANTFSDANGDTLTYSFTELVGTASWLSFDAATRTFSGMPPASEQSVTLRLTAFDPAGLNVSDDFVINLTDAVSNVAPIVANPVADQTTVREQAFTFTFAANTFSDANGDTLAYSYTELVGTASWLSFDAQARTFSGMPPASAQSVTLRLTATDPAGLSVSDDFVINLTDAGANVAPIVANPIADQTAVRQQAFSFTFAADTFTDANGDTLTYSYSKLVGSAFWLNFDAATRTFSGQPYNFSNNVTIRLTATDSGGLSVYEDFVIAVVDSAQMASMSLEDSSTQTTAAEASALTPADADQVTSFAYDAAGRVLRQTDGTGAVTRYVHDAAGRTVYTIDPLGNYTRNWYDQAGRLTATRQFSTPLDPAGLSDNSTVAQLDTMLVTSVADQGSYFVYDASGRLRYAMDLAGTLTESTYDSAGRQVSSRTYVTSVVVDSTLASKLLAGTAAGSLSAPAANDSADRVSYAIYNELGQVRMRVDGAGNVTAVTYDAAGRVITEKRFAQAANISTLRAGLKAGTTTVDQLSALTPSGAAADSMVYHVYDAAGRLRYTINSLGHTSESLYDAAGRQVGTRSYANAINLAAQATLVTAMNAGTATPDGVAAALTADAARDSQSYVVFNGAGQSRFAVDALGAVVETRHDAAGRVTEELAYVTPVAFSAADKAALAQGSYSATSLAAAVSAQEPSARKSQSVYDAAGQLVYSLSRSDATQAVVSERRYDAAGRVIAQINYGVTLNYDSTRSQAQVADAIIAAQGDLASNQRLTRNVYDAAGHLRFSIDDAGAVSEQTYDALGQVTGTRLYATPIVISDPTADGVAAAVAGQTGVRQTTYTYDNAGRLKTSTDNLDQVESYSYDALGQRISRTDKLGNTWTTEFDAAGRLIKETSPPVDVASVDNAGLVTVSPTPRAIVTQTAYDALGNVISRTEDATGAKPRITQYEYDAAGHQVRTIFPRAGQVNPTTGLLEDTLAASETRITYDALGRAVVQNDVLGNYSYKTYTVLGQLAFEVDAEGYATGYAYNAYGEQSSLTRYANRLVTTGAQFTGWDAGEPITLTQAQAGAIANSADRVLNNAYDVRGNKLSVAQKQITYYKAGGSPATGSPTTEFTYDAYGQLVKESVLLEASVWADTYHYFDDLGRETMTVDAEGYVTTRQYDALGQVTMQVEYARAVDTSILSTASAPNLPVGGDVATSFDRLTRFTYDALGRKSSESIRRSFTQTSGTIGMRETVSVLGYDAADQLRTTTIDGVLTTTLEYDAFGRTISVQEAERDVLRANAETLLLNSTGTDLGSASIYERSSPFRALDYDAFGNVVRQTRYANGMRSGVLAEDASRDQKTVTRYDWQGRAVMTIDAEGNRSYSSFDAADHATHQWHALRGATASADAVVHQYFVYDKAGRQTETRSTRAVGAGAEVMERDQFAAYNAFGEITAQAMTLVDLDDANKSIRSTYDAAGRLIGSNRDSGAVRDFGYNLAGHQVREQRYVSQLNGTTPTTYPEIYLQVTDRLGRVVQTVLPSYTSNRALTSTVVRTLDRWGNVLVEIDPRGFITRNEYNEQNQKTRQIAPQVEVVGEDGMVRWQAPETHWMFDALGRLSATRDANGNVHQSIYDTGGQLIGSVDATGALTKQGYDALGNARISQNAVGYLAWQAFDRNARVTAQGDYLPGLEGIARLKTNLQRYTLNQDGQRVIVMDALDAQAQYDYDGAGQLLHSKTAMNVQLDYGYDLQGRKTRETNGLNVSQTWTYDVFGRLTDHDDLSGKDYNYTYNPDSGQLTNETSGWGANRTTAYFANGLVARIDEGSNWFTYQYDANGNRTYEETKTVDGGLVTQGGAVTLRQRTRSTYDSNNRLVRVISEDLNVSTGAVIKVILDVKYGYDAVGNRRVVVADSGYGNGVAAPSATNQAPIVIGTPESRSVKTGVTTWIRLRPADVFQDPEQFALTYSATLSSGTWPTWLHLSTAELASTGELLFTVDPEAPAGTSKTVRLRATDASGASSYVDFTLSVVTNTAPVSTSGATPVLNINTGVAFAAELPIASYFKDNDAGDLLTYSVDSVSPAAAWLLSDASTAGSLRLSGTPTSAGTYTVTLRATDGSGATVTRTMQIVVAGNAAPISVAGTIATQVALIGRDFEFERPLDQLFTDANNDVLSVSATLADGTALPMWLNLQLLTDTNPPTLRLVAQVPSSETTRTFAVVLTAKDPTGASVSRTVNIELVADPGVLALLNPVPNQTANATGYSWSYVLPSNAFATSNNVAPVYSVSGMPGWLSFDAATRTFSGIPAPVGTWSVTVTAAAGADEVSDTFTITTPNAAPKLAIPLTDQNLVLNTTMTAYTFAAGTFTDPNNQSLTYTATGMPPGVTFNASQRKFSGKPTATGAYTVTVTASDGSLTKTGAFVMSVSPGGNLAPVVNIPLADGAADAEGWFYYTFPANAFIDPNAGQALTYTASGMPGTITFNGNTRTFEGNATLPNKTYTVTVKASDPYGLYVTDSFVLTVTTVGGGGQMLMMASTDGGETQSVMSLPANTLLQNLKVAPVTTATAYNVGDTSGTPVRNFQQSWYTYDAENRVQVSQGTLTAGQILANAGMSYEQRYDAVGNATVRLKVMSDGLLRIDRTGYSLRGEQVRQYGTQILGDATVNTLVMSSTFDANGRLLEARHFFPAEYVENYVDDEGILYLNRPVGGWLSSVDHYTYDADGRVRTQVSMGRDPGRTMKTTTSGNQYSIVNWLNDDNFIGDAVAQKTDLTVLTHLKASVDYTIASGGYDVIGRLMGYAYSQDGDTQPGFTWTYGYTYSARDSYLEATIVGTGTGNYKATDSVSTYDAYGRRTAVKETTKRKDLDDLVTLRYFGYDGYNGILSRRDGYLKDGSTWKQAEETTSILVNPVPQFISASVWSGYTKAQREAVVAAHQNQRFAYANGQLIGSVSQSGGNLDARSRLTAYSNSDIGRSAVTVQSGDTLQGIAQRVYGNSSLWYVLASANAITDDSQLVAGTQLVAPSVTVSKNDANTFKPYDPNQIIGPTAPNLPYIPDAPALQCQALSTLIGIVVAIVVTVYTCNPVAGAAAGNAASQYSSLILNGEFDMGRFLSRTLHPSGGSRADWERTMYDPAANGAPGKADYKSIAISAAAAFITAPIGNVYVQVAATYVVNYGLSKAAGYDVHWSNRTLIASLAATYVSNTVFKASTAKPAAKDGSVGTVAPQPGPQPFSWPRVWSDAVQNVARSAIQYGIQRVLGDKSAHWNNGMVLADAFGNAYGNAVAGDVEYERGERAKAVWAAAQAANDRNADPYLYSLASTDAGGTHPDSSGIVAGLVDWGAERLIRGVDSLAHETYGSDADLFGTAKKRTFTSGLSDADASDALIPTPEAISLLRTNSVAQMAAGTGLVTSFGVQAYGDLEGLLSLSRLQAKATQYLAGTLIDGIDPGNTVGRALKTAAGTEEQIKNLVYLAKNLPEIIQNLPEEARNWATSNAREGTAAFNQGNYAEAFYNYGKLLYPIAGAAIPAGGAASGGLKALMRSVKPLTRAEAVVPRTVARAELAAERAGSRSRAAGDTAVAASSREVSVLTRHRAGNTQVLVDGQRWNVPADRTVSAVPELDGVGDVLQRATNDAAKAWNPRRNLSINERLRIAEARDAKQTWRANLLEQQAKGRWIEAQVRGNPEVAKLGLQWNRKGVDAVSPTSGLSYDIMSGSKSNTMDHARRMSTVLFRMITF